MKYKKKLQISFFLKKLNKEKTSFLLWKLPLIDKNITPIEYRAKKYYLVWKSNKLLLNSTSTFKFNFTSTQKRLSFFLQKISSTSFISTYYSPSYKNTFLVKSIFCWKDFYGQAIVNFTWLSFVRKFTLDLYIFHFFLFSLNRFSCFKNSKFRSRKFKDNNFYNQRLL